MDMQSLSIKHEPSFYCLISLLTSILLLYTISFIMDIVSLPEFEGFDRDQGNIEKKWIAHQVTPQESEQVFFNIPLIVADDEKHSRTEKRYLVLGQTDKKTGPYS